MLKAGILQPSASFQPSFSALFLQMYIRKNVILLIFNELQESNIHPTSMIITTIILNFAVSNILILIIGVR